MPKMNIQGTVFLLSIVIMIDMLLSKIITQWPHIFKIYYNDIYQYNLDGPLNRQTF